MVLSPTKVRTYTGAIGSGVGVGAAVGTGVGLITGAGEGAGGFTSGLVIRRKAYTANRIADSAINNILFILGVVPLIKPLYGRGITGIDLLTMLLLSVMLLPFAGRRGIGRYAGASMFLIYLAYLAYLVFRSAV